MLWLAALPGCELFQTGTDIIDGLLNPLVAGGIVVAVEAPQSDDTGLTGEFDLAAAGLDEGTTMNLFLARANDVTEIESAPVVDATVTIDGVEANMETDGLYVVGPGNLEWSEGSSWDIEATFPEAPTATATVTLPQAATFTLPVLVQDTPITIDLTGQGFDSALVVVFEAGSGLTYSNEPTTAREFYDFTHTGGEVVTTLEIPGDAFPEPGFYAVGVAGLAHTTADDLLEMNTALSTVTSGKMVFELQALLPGN